MTKPSIETIGLGFQVYAKEGGEEFGAVRAVRPGGRAELVVYVENAGDFSVPFHAITAVHDGKVILDMSAVESALREAVRHAHERELPHT
jgi:hypothetical protein